MVTALGAALGKSLVDLAQRSERPILRRISENNKENRFVVRGNGTMITMTTTCEGDTRFKTQDVRLDTLRAGAQSMYASSSHL